MTKASKICIDNTTKILLANTCMNSNTIVIYKRKPDSILVCYERGVWRAVCKERPHPDLTTWDARSD